MEVSFKLNRSILKVFSAICSNLFVVWFIASFATHNLFTLTFNIVAATLSLYLAIKSEQLLEEL